MKWINIDDEMPLMNECVLVVCDEIIVQAFWNHTEEWLDCRNDWRLNDVTHWAEMPELPYEHQL